MKLSDKPDFFFSAPTIERSRRCQNCIHFDNGPKAHTVYETKRMQELELKARQALEKAGISLIGKQFDAKRALALISDADEGMRLLKQGAMGLCAKSKVPGDFTRWDVLCESWEERYKPDGAEKGDITSADTRAAVFGPDDPEQTEGAALRPKDKAK